MKKLYYIILFLMITSGINAQWKYSNFPEGSYIYKTAKNGNTLFAATNFDLYTSADQGLNWIAAKIPNSYISPQDFAFRNNDAFIAATKGVYKSTDQGLSLTQLFAVTDDYLKCIAVKGNTIFVGGANAFYRSVDDGKSWTKINIATPPQQLFMNDLELKGDSLFASTQEAFYLSTNDGDNWTKINQTDISFYQLVRLKNTLLTVSNGIHFSTDEGKNWSDTKLSANSITVDNYIAYATGIDGIYSSSNGINWSKIANFTFKEHYGALTVSGSKFYVATQSGIYMSTDAGATWNFSSKGIHALEVLEMVQSASTIYASTLRGLMASTDEGESWKNLTPGIAVSALKIIGNTLYVGTYLDNPGIMFSTDNGLTWTHSNKKFEQYVFDFLAVDKTIFAATSHNIYTSTDGIKWTDVSEDEINAPDMSLVFCLGSDGEYLYAGTIAGMYRSGDKGVTWHALKNTPFDNFNVNSIIIQNQNMVVASGVGNYLSTDKGVTWKLIGPYQTVFSNATFISGDLFVGNAEGRLYISNDIGNTWTDISEGLPAYGGFVNVIRRNDNIFLGSYTGVWKRLVTDIPIGLTEQNKKENTISPFPNPSNGLFTIIGPSENYSVEIINMIGKRIYKVDHASDKQVIDLRDQVNGIYFITIKTEGGKNFNSKIVIR